MSGHFVARTAIVSTGLIAWAGQFGLVYAVAGLVCAGRVPADGLLGYGTIPAATVVVTALAVAATVIAALHGRRTMRRAGTSDEAERFLGWMTIALSALSLLAILYTALPSFVSLDCGS